MPEQKYFKPASIVSELSDAQEHHYQAEIVAELLAICKNHKEIIETYHDTYTYIENELGEFIPDADTQLVMQRLNVIERYIYHLEQASSKLDLNEFKNDYHNSKAIFTKDNDSIGKLFVSAISCVITRGLKAAFSMWKEGVNAIDGTYRIDDILSNNPTNR